MAKNAANDSTNRQAFSSKYLLRFLMYIGIIAICIAAILYMLFQARPREDPKMKEAAPKSQLQAPERQPKTASPTLVSAPGSRSG